MCFSHCLSTIEIGAIAQWQSIRLQNKSENDCSVDDREVHGSTPCGSSYSFLLILTIFFSFVSFLGSPMHAKLFDEKIASEIDIPIDMIPSIIPGLESNEINFYFSDFTNCYLITFRISFRKSFTC